MVEAFDGPSEYELPALSRLLVHGAVTRAASAVEMSEAGRAELAKLSLPELLGLAPAAARASNAALLAALLRYAAASSR